MHTIILLSLKIIENVLILYNIIKKEENILTLYYLLQVLKSNNSKQKLPWKWTYKRTNLGNFIAVWDSGGSI